MWYNCSICNINKHYEITIKPNVNIKQQNVKSLFVQDYNNFTSDNHGTLRVHVLHAEVFYNYQYQLALLLMHEV